MNKKGLTFIEMMVVVAIVSLLLLLTVVNTFRLRAEAKVVVIESEFRTIYTSIVMYQLDKNSNPKSWNDLKNYIDVSRFENDYEINEDYK